jgi:plastocyanin
MNNKVILSVILVMLLFNITVGYYAFAEPPDYLISTTPELSSVSQGDSLNFTIILAPLRNFNSEVFLRTVEVPQGIDVEFDEDSIRLDGEKNVTLSVNIQVDQESPAGLYDLIIEANGGGLIHNAVEQIDIIGTGRIIVIIKDFWYFPDNLTIRKGSSVTWINQDLTGHTSTADNGEFDTELLRQNQRYTIPFDDIGNFPYFCIPHPQMVASVKVVE